MLIVEVLASSGFLFGDQLHTVIVDENVGGTTLHFICGDSSLDGVNGRFNDTSKTFLVDRHLDRDVRECTVIVSKTFGRDTRVELCVGVHLGDGTDELTKVTDKSLEEEKTEPDLSGNDQYEQQAEVIAVNGDFLSNTAVTGTNGGDSDGEGETGHGGLNEHWTARLPGVCALHTVTHVATDLVDVDTGALLVTLLVRLTTLAPDHLHECLLDVLSTVEQVPRLIVPDYQNTTVGDKGSELMLLATGKVGHVWKNLETETTLERDEWLVVVVEEELDDTSVDSHGRLQSC